MGVSADLRQEFTISTPITIRKCAAEDLPELEWFGLFTEHREIFEYVFQRQKRGENLMLVADLNGHPVGQVWIDLMKRRSESVGVLWAARVFPWLQRLGIGRLLFRAAEQALRRRGFDYAELGVEKANQEAFAFYERLGYRRVGSSQDEYSYTTPEGVFMRIPLDLWIHRKDLRSTKSRVTPSGTREGTS